MNEMKLTRCEAFHEIGHAIVAYLFNGYVTTFQKIILNKQDIKDVGGHPNDLAYTHQKKAKDFEIKTKDNVHLCAAVFGLTFLAGIGGATYLCPETTPSYKNVTKENFNVTLNTRGASGDLELLSNPQHFYANHLFNNGFDKNSAYLIHAKLMNVLQELFLSPEIRNAAKEIYNLIEAHPNVNIELSEFERIFSVDMVTKYRTKLEFELATENIGKFMT